VKGGTVAAESSFVRYRGSFADDNRASAGVFMEPDESGRLYGGWASKRGGWTTENYVAYGEWDGLIRSKSNTYFPCEGLYTNIPFNNLADGNDVLIEQYGLAAKRRPPDVDADDLGERVPAVAEIEGL
jgi:hypothetical protein